MKKYINYYGVNADDKREKLLNSEIAKPIIKELLLSADFAISTDNIAFKMSEFLQFETIGNRTIYEKGYFERRRRCTDIFMAYWLTQDEKYLMPLIDHIFYICDEFTWCLPAHYRLSKGTVSEAITYVDLFQSETARMFCEIIMCLGDKLPPYVFERMQMEIERRILPSFRNNDEEKYTWMRTKTNWSAVCSTGVSFAFLIFGKENEFEEQLHKFIGCLDHYLEGIGDDGCCLEGMAYWSYGFSHFVTLSQILKVYSDGKIDYFKLPKVHEIAKFPQNVRLSDSLVASISDTRETFKIKIGLISLLKSMYDDVILPELKYGTRLGNIDSICELLWLDENYKGEQLKNQNTYLPDAQWYVSRRPKYSFVAKGGRNNEPHNHNDVGSFMITVGDNTFISDLGSGEYVEGTFRPETRYNFVQNSSRGHSVPVINGEFQINGIEHCANNVLADENTFSLDIEDAYKDEIVNKINRKFTLYEDSIVLTDTITHSDETNSVTERYISKIEPTICDGYVDYGMGKILYDANRYTAVLNTETYIDHNGIDVITVYQLDFAPVSNDETKFEFTFKM